MSAGTIRFEGVKIDQKIFEELSIIYAEHKVKAKLCRAMQYVKDFPSGVTLKTTLITLPIIAAAGTAGGVIGFAAGGAGTPVGIGVGVGIATGTVAGIGTSILYISHSSHYEAWKRDLKEKHDRPLFKLFEEILEKDTEELYEIRDPISGELIRLPVRAPDGVVYDLASIRDWIQHKPNSAPASIYRTCDFGVANLEFDFPTAEKIIKTIESYKKAHQNDEHREVMVAGLNLIEKDLHERICARWAVEIENLKKSNLSQLDFTNCVERVRKLFHLDKIGSLLAGNPLIARDVDKMTTSEKRGEDESFLIP